MIINIGSITHNLNVSMNAHEKERKTWIIKKQPDTELTNIAKVYGQRWEKRDRNGALDYIDTELINMFDIGLNPMFFMLHGRKFFMLLECLRICFAFNLFRLQTRTRYGVYECYSHKKKSYLYIPLLCARRTSTEEACG